ncbi:hypothetical protein F5888DRAFT_1681280 [Russula emetica]|nr:hypothetical protein F5888DRAFT_1681280 [Russula emetica]
MREYALAQVGVVRTTWASIVVSWLQCFDHERWKRDETLRLANARQTKASKLLTAPRYMLTSCTLRPYTNFSREN